MKLILLAFMLLGISSCVREEVPETWMPDPDLINNPIDNRLVTSNSVVFLGDSLTHIGIWKNYFPEVETANAGWGGNITQQVLDRLQPIIDAKPRKIFLLIGANDLNFGVPKEVISANHAKIIERIMEGSPQTKLYVQSIMPFGEDIRYFFKSVPETFKKDITELNVKLKEICEVYGVPFLNNHVAVANQRGFLKQEYTDDRIHLSKIGYDAWVKFLRSYVLE